MGKVTQYGAQEAFQRARQQIFIGNLPKGAVVAPNSYMSVLGGAGPGEIEYARDAANNAVLTQSFLRLIQPLTANLNIFTFPVQVDQPTVNAGETRLQKQDALFGSNIMFYMAKGGSSTDTSYQVHTFPNPVTWATGALTGGLYSVYNGTLVLAINKSVIVPAYSMRNFMQQPQTQLTGAANTPQDQFDPSEVGLLEPTWNFIGTKQHNLQIQMTANMTATIEANTIGIFDIQGVLAQNVTMFT